MSDDDPKACAPAVLDVPVCRNPIFVIGSPRSGTTILALSLARHSRLWYSSESHFFPLLFGLDLPYKFYAEDMSRRGWLWHAQLGEREFIESLGMGINALFTSRSDGKRWIEKTPQNTVMVGTLADMFPHAVFLHILRDGRAVVNSMIHMAAAPHWYKSFRIACRAWSNYVTAAMRFQARNPDRCLTIRHEQLVADPGPGFAQIFRFIREPHDADPADYFCRRRLNSSFKTYSGARLQDGRVTDAWTGWTRDQRSIFLDEAGAALVQYGLVTEAGIRHLERETRDGDG